MNLTYFRPKMRGNVKHKQGPSLWGGHVPPNFWTGGDIISFGPPQHFVIKINVVVQISCYFTVGNVSPA